MSAALDVAGVSKRFQGATHPALDDVSLSIQEGQSVGLIGESGSGKSTLARIIVGLEEADAGSVRSRELVLAGPGRPSRGHRRTMEKARTVQMVFQDPYQSLDPRRTVLDSVSWALRVHGESKARARAVALDALEQVGLGEREASSLPRRLSGGQRQRAAIARAVSLRPRLLVLDEAVSALDVSVQAQVLNLLSDLRAKHGMSFLFITHHLGVVRQATDAAVVLRRGQVVESGETAQLLREPQHEYTRLLIDSVPGRVRRALASANHDLIDKETA